MIVVLYMVLFVLMFSAIQAIVLRRMGTTPIKEAIKQLDKVKDMKGFQNFVARKQITLKKTGADIFLKDGLTVSKWYLYKSVFCVAGFMIAMFITKGVVKSDVWLVSSILVAVLFWFILDLFIRIENKSSNDAMIDRKSVV